MTILHIVPSLPYNADIALTLACGLRRTYQLNSAFYSHKPLKDNVYSTYDFEEIQSNATSLHESIGQDISTILLHVNSWTYNNFKSKSSANDFLYQLETALNRRSLELITIFHDIPTTKFGSYFNIQKSSQSFTKNLANLSRSVVTNNGFYERHLIENTGSPIYTVNTFSRVGELESNNLLGASRCNLIILGGYERANIYKKKSLLQQTMNTLKLSQIVDIGPSIPWSRINTKGLSIKQMGQLTKSEISDQLTISKIGLLDYSRYPNCLGKSSVFNAYKAHGVVPLLFKDIESISDHLNSKVNYFSPKNFDLLKSDRTISKMAHNNYSHYLTHNQAKWVKLISDLVKG